MDVYIRLQPQLYSAVSVRVAGVAMACYDSDESDGAWGNYGSWDYHEDYWYDDDDDYWYDNNDDDDDDDYDEYEYDDDDYEYDDDDDDPWNNTLDQQEEDDIIVENMKRHKMSVHINSHQKLKYFTVRGEGLFECKGCDNRWTSHNATIKVDLFKKCISKKFRQRCKHCPTQWATPFFTDDRFEEIMEKVADKYKRRLKGDDHDNKSVFVAAGNGKPHPQQYCEKCQELGTACWKYVISAV